MNIFCSLTYTKLFTVCKIFNIDFEPLQIPYFRGWTLNFNFFEKNLSMCTTFVLHVLTNYFQEKRYLRSKLKNRQNYRKIFASLFSGPGELLGKSPPGKSKPRFLFRIEHSILCKNFKTLALKVTEEIRGQEGPLKSH